MRLDKNRILKLSEDIRNGNGLIEELIEALGGKRLYDVFDEQTIDSLVSNVVNNGKFHTLIDDGNGFDILEGLLNDKVKGNLTDFYMIKLDYILALSKKQQKNMAESISGGDKELANSLQNLWEKGIKTEACSTKRSDDKPMFQLSIDADDEVSQELIQQIYSQNDIEGSVFYTCFEGGKRFQVNLWGDDLYKYVSKNKELDMSRNKKNIFLSAVKEGIGNDEEILNYYIENNIDVDVSGLKEGINNAKHILERLNKKEKNVSEASVNNSEFVNSLKEKIISQDEIIKEDINKRGNLEIKKSVPSKEDISI